MIFHGMTLLSSPKPTPFYGSKYLQKAGVYPNKIEDSQPFQAPSTYLPFGPFRPLGTLSAEEGNPVQEGRRESASKGGCQPCLTVSSVLAGMLAKLLFLVQNIVLDQMKECLKPRPTYDFGSVPERAEHRCEPQINAARPEKSPMRKKQNGG